MLLCELMRQKLVGRQGGILEIYIRILRLYVEVRQTIRSVSLAEFEVGRQRKSPWMGVLCKVLNSSAI